MLLDLEKKKGMNSEAESESHIDKNVEQKIEITPTVESAASLTPTEAARLDPDLSLENKVIETKSATGEQGDSVVSGEVKPEVTEDEAKQVLEALLNESDPAEMERLSQGYSQ